MQGRDYLWGLLAQMKSAVGLAIKPAHERVVLFHAAQSLWVALPDVALDTDRLYIMHCVAASQEPCYGVIKVSGVSGQPIATKSTSVVLCSEDGCFVCCFSRWGASVAS